MPSADHAEALPCLNPDPTLPCHFPEALAWSSIVPGARSPAEQPEGLKGLWWADGRFFFFAVCKEPPYKVEESGYAGFIMLIEVYFKNKVRDWMGGGWKVPVTMGRAGQCAKEMGLGASTCQPSSEAEARIMIPAHTV